MLAIYSKVARRFSLTQRSHSFQLINGLPSPSVEPSHFFNGGGSDGIITTLFLQPSFPSQTRSLGDYAEGETTDELWLSVLSTNSGAAGSSPALTALVSRLANFPHVARIGPQRTLAGVMALQDYASSLGLCRHWFFDDPTAAALIARFSPQVLAWRLTQIRETIWGHLDDLSPDRLRERYLSSGTHVGGEGKGLGEASVGTPDGGKLRPTLSPQLREGQSASTSSFPNLSRRRDLLDHIALDLIEKSARLRALAGEDVLVSVLLKSIPELLHRNVDELCVSHHRDGEWVSIVSTHDGNRFSAVSNSSVTMTNKGFRKISESSQDSARVVSMAADVKAGGAMIQRYGNVLLVNLNPEKHVVVIGRMQDGEAMEKGVKEVGRGGDEKQSRQAELKKDVESKGGTVIRVFRRKKQAGQGAERGGEGRGEGEGGREIGMVGVGKSEKTKKAASRAIPYTDPTLAAAVPESRSGKVACPRTPLTVQPVPECRTSPKPVLTNGSHEASTAVNSSNNNININNKDNNSSNSSSSNNADGSSNAGTTKTNSPVTIYTMKTSSKSVTKKHAKNTNDLSANSKLPINSSVYAMDDDGDGNANGNITNASNNSKSRGMTNGSLSGWDMMSGTLEATLACPPDYAISDLAADEAMRKLGGGVRGEKEGEDGSGKGPGKRAVEGVAKTSQAPLPSSPAQSATLHASSTPASSLRPPSPLPPSAPSAPSEEHPQIERRELEELVSLSTEAEAIVYFSQEEGFAELRCEGYRGSCVLHY